MNAVQKRIHQAAIQLFAEKSVGEISVSELAQLAGVARGTVYNNLHSVDSLFEEIAGELSQEMNQRVVNSAAEGMDPVLRLANGIRFYVRRAHEEPQWGHFIVRYAASNNLLQELWNGQPVQDVLNGIAHSRYLLKTEQLPAAMALIGGAVLAATLLVLQGHMTWRDAGSDTAAFILRALGVDAEEAQRLASQDLPPLAPAHCTLVLDAGDEAHV